jgi:hypothetical protein
MARGDKNRITQQSQQMGQQAQQLTAQQQAQANQALQQGQALQKSILPGYQDIVAHPGYTAGEKAAMGTAAEEGTGAAFGSAQEALARRAAKTRNVAGVGEMADVLARERAKATGETAAGLQQKFADTAFQRKMAGLEGMGQLYGIDQQTLRTMLGMPAEDIGAGARALEPGAQLAAIPGFWGQLGGAFAGQLGRGLGAAITGPVPG